MRLCETFDAALDSLQKSINQQRRAACPRGSLSTPGDSAYAAVRDGRDVADAPFYAAVRLRITWPTCASWPTARRGSAGEVLPST